MCSDDNGITAINAYLSMTSLPVPGLLRIYVRERAFKKLFREKLSKNQQHTRNGD